MGTETKNLYLALILMAVLFFVYNYYLMPPVADTASPTTTAEVSPKTPSPTPAPPSPPAKNIAFATTDSLQASPTTHTLENDKIKITLSSQGGSIANVALKDYKTYQQQPLDLLNKEYNNFSYQFTYNNAPVNTADYNFKTIAADNQSITYRLYADSSRYIEQKYTLVPSTAPDTPQSYLLDYNLQVVGFGNTLSQNELQLVWKNTMQAQEKDINNERYSSTIYYKVHNDDVEYLSERSDETRTVETQSDWLSFKQQFFNITLMSKGEPLGKATYSLKTPGEDTQTTEVKHAESTVALPYQPAPTWQYPMQFYIGPNKYDLLKQFDNDLHQLVPLGWFVFRLVNKWMIIPLFKVFNSFTSNYGIIIILLTLAVKFLLFPLTYRSTMSFAKMNAIKPELDALKAKHAKDPQLLQTETMRLYGEAGINPLGGCLPQLLQLPILIAMYRFFPASVELRQEHFLWADDLSSYDSIFHLPFKIPFYGDHVSLFCLLAAISQVAYMRLNQQMTPTTSPEMEMQMKIMQYTMPVMLLLFFNNVAAGLGLYFLLSTVITFAQQYYIKNFMVDENKIRQEIEENKKRPNKSSFQQRLDEMIKTQQGQQRQQSEQ